jgi:hypothetical protein
VKIEPLKNQPGPGKAPSQTASAPDVEFGALIATRRGTVVAWVLAFIAVVIAGLLAWAALSLNTPRDRQTAIVFALAAAGLAALSVWIVLRLLRTFEFREFGVVVYRRGKLLQSMRYDACTSFRYELARQYVNGIYAGTTLVITLRDAEKRRIRWNGTHKEKSKGFSFFSMGRNFQGEDELDVVKMIIADTIADRWVDRLLAGESIAWGAMSLTQTHVIPKKGKYKHRSIPHAEIDRLAADQGWFHLFRVGDEKAFFSMQMNAENFWPGMRVMERMWQANAGSAGDGELDSPDSIQQDLAN